MPDEFAAPAIRIPSAAEAVLLLAKRPKAKRLAQAFVIGSTVWPVVKGRWKKWHEETLYTVSLPAEDDIYADVHAWLLKNLPSGKQRALLARSRRVRNAEDDWLADEPSPKPVAPAVALFYDGTREQTVELEGHKVKVQIEKEGNGTHGRLSEEQMQKANWDKEKITFTMRGEEARDAVVRFLHSVSAARVEEPVRRFFVCSRWGDWRRRGDLPPRTLDTIVLRDGQQEELVQDLTEFFAAEKAYARLGLPWHRGYLFHGPPGTGKTSMARALANHFEMDVHYIPLSDLDADANLIGLLSSLDPRSMLVLEDVDVVHGAKSRDDAESGGISLSGLLNALDGLATPHGLITVMTTNDLKVLDKALIRAGRVDRQDKFGYLDEDQLQRLCDMILGYPAELPTTGGLARHPKLTHADVIEWVKRDLESPTACEAILRKKLG